MRERTTNGRDECCVLASINGKAQHPRRLQRARSGEHGCFFSRASLHHGSWQSSREQGQREHRWQDARCACAFVKRRGSTCVTGAARQFLILKHLCIMTATKAESPRKWAADGRMRLRNRKIEKRGGCGLASATARCAAAAAASRARWGLRRSNSEHTQL